MPRLPRPQGIAAALLIAGLILLSACSAAHSAPGGVLRLAYPGDPPDLNSMTAVDSISWDVLDQVLEGLTRPNAAGVPEPAIARSWTVSPDGLTYTFHLRQARWSDGEAVTAQDFVYAWQQALDPRHATGAASMLQYVAGAPALLGLQLPDPTKNAAGYRAAVAQIAPLEAKLGVRAQGTQTLVVTLAQPAAYWLSLTGLPVYFPAPQADVQRWGWAAYGSDPQHLLADGPFVLTTWVHNSQVAMQRNPDYWDASAVALQGVTAQIVTSESTISNLFAAHQIDGILPSIPPEYVAAYRGSPGYVSTPAAVVAYIQFSVTSPGLGSALVRQAFSLAIDRAALAGQVVGAGALPASSLVPPTIDYAPGQRFGPLVGALLPAQAEAATARADLAAGLRAAGLTKLPPLALLVPPDAASQTQAQALQAMWQATLGIKVSIESPDGQTYVGDLESGQFQMALLGWNADYNDPSDFLDLFQTGNGNNFGHWSDPAFDAKLQAADAQTNAAVRGTDLAAAEKLLLAQMPAIPLWWSSTNYILAPDVHGLVVNLTGPDYYLGHVTITPGS